MAEEKIEISRENEKEEIQKEKQQLKEQKRNKKKMKKARLRPLKNFIWWLVGFVCCLVIIVAVPLAVVKFVPMKTLFGNSSSDIVSDSLAEKSILDAIIQKDESGKTVLFKDIKVKDVPILQSTINSLSTDSGLSGYVNINVLLIEDEYINSENGTFFDKIMNAITLNPECLGKLSSLSALKEVSSVIGEVDRFAANFNAKLYYYLYSGGENPVYKRAFDNAGNFVEGVDEHTELFYPSLSLIPLNEVGDVFGDILGRVKAIDVLEIFSSNIDQTVKNFIGDKTLNELSEIDIESMPLTNFIEVSEKNKSMFDIIYSATGCTAKIEDENDYSEITFGKLKNIDIDGVTLSSVIPVEGNEKVFDLLFAALGLQEQGGAKNYDLITLGKLGQGINIDSVPLTTVLAYSEQNKDLFEILYSATGCTAKIEGENDYSKITIGMLSDISLSGSLDKIKLVSVLPRTADNQGLYDIIYSATGCTAKIGSEKDYGAIYVGDLAKINLDKITITTVLPDDGTNDAFYNILKDVYEDIDSVTLANLGSFDTSNIKLVSVLKQEESNVKLYDILYDIVGCTATVGELRDYSAITLKSLKTIDFNKLSNIKLTSVLENNEENKNLYDILKDVFGEDVQEITLGDLKNFDAGKVKFKTVVSESENVQLYGILRDVFGQDLDAITLGGMKDFDVMKIKFGTVLSRENNAKIYEILDEAIDLPVGVNSVEEMKLSDMNSAFTIDNIKLATVLGESDNAVIKALIEKDATVGELGAKLNALTVFEIYGKNCFTTDPTLTNNEDDKYVYDEVSGTFTLNEGGTYYRNKNMGAWLLVCFDITTDPTTGKATEFKAAEISMGDIQNNGSLITDKIASATVRELIDIGMLSDSPMFEIGGIYTKTLSEALGGNA